MFQEEIVVTPGLVGIIVGNIMCVAGSAHGFVKGNGIGVFLRSPCVQHRCQICAATEPLTGGDHHTGVHVNGGDMRVLRVSDQADAGGPEARILVGTGDLTAKLGREFTVYGGNMDADLLENAAMHHGHDAAATLCPGAVGALPGRAFEAPGRLVGQRTGEIADLVLQVFKSLADTVSQLLEPGRCGCLLVLDAVRDGTAAVFRCGCVHVTAWTGWGLPGRRACM